MAAAPGVGAAGGRARRRGPLRHSLCAYDREAGCGSKNRVAVARRRDSSGYHERRPPRAQTGTADRLPGHKPGAHRDIQSRWGSGPGWQVKPGPNRPGGGRPLRAWINCSEDSRERRVDAPVSGRKGSGPERLGPHGSHGPHWIHDPGPKGRAGDRPGSRITSKRPESGPQGARAYRPLALR